MDSSASSLDIEYVDSVESFTVADQLGDLLAQLDKRHSPVYPGYASSISEIPEDESQSSDLPILLQAADEIAHRLRAENAALHENYIKLQSNIMNLIEENNRLHEELRNAFVSDMLHVLNTGDDEQAAAGNESQVIDTYTTRLRSLENELKDTKEKLSMYDNIWHTASDLAHCLKCGALLPFTQHISERSESFVDIMAENEANKRKLQQIQGKLDQGQVKEREALTKLQQSMAFAEQCKFENAEAIAERDRIKVEYIDVQKRLNKLIDEMNSKIADEKNKIEAIYQEKIEQNVAKMKQIEILCQQHELTIDRLSREKNSLTADLIVWKERIQQQEIDLSQATDSVKLTIQKATRERDQANSNAMQIRSDYEKLLSQSNQDLAQVRYQLRSAQTRLESMENELLQSKKQCLDLTEDINRLTREIITLKTINQNLEQSREENLNAIILVLNQREQEYHGAVENLQLERNQSLSGLENLVCSQNAILEKLRSYSRKLTKDIQKIVGQKDQIIQKTTVENQELRVKLSNTYKRLEEVDSQLCHHNELHLKLNRRIIDLNQKVKNYENIINNIKVSDLVEYERKLAVRTEKS